MKNATRLRNAISELGRLIGRRNKKAERKANLEYARRYLATRDPERALKVSDTWLATLIVADQFNLEALVASHSIIGSRAGSIVVREAIANLLKTRDPWKTRHALDFAACRYDAWSRECLAHSPALANLYARRCATIHQLAQFCF